MSSLLQFNGHIDPKRGVGLLFYKATPGTYTPVLGLYGAECYVCACGKSHEQLYRAYRKPAGMLGPWVQFRYNNDIHSPDLSVPIAIDTLPKDAKALTITECSTYWHGS